MPQEQAHPPQHLLPATERTPARSQCGLGWGGTPDPLCPWAGGLWCWSGSGRTCPAGQTNPSSHCAVQQCWAGTRALGADPVEAQYSRACQLHTATSTLSRLQQHVGHAYKRGNFNMQAGHDHASAYEAISAELHWRYKHWQRRNVGALHSIMVIAAPLLILISVT